MIPVSPEIHFILCCCWIAADQDAIADMAEAADRVTDWDAVFTLSARQRLLPLVYKNIRTYLADRAPESCLARFKAAYLANTGKNLTYVAFLLRTIDLLEQHDIRVLPFKGPALAQDVYGDAALRVFVDLDLLIRRDDALKAWRILRDNGYQPELNLEDEQKKKYVAAEDDQSFVLADKAINIELHWELSGRYLSSPLTFEAIAAEMEPLVLGDRDVLKLKREFLLLYLCVHGCKDGWNSLEQVYLIAEIIRQSSAFDWSRLDRLADHWTCRTMVRVGIAMALRLFAVRVPIEMARQIEKDDRAARVADGIIERLLDPADSLSDNSFEGRFSRMHLAVRDSFVEQLRYALKLAFMPTKKEWLYFPLPARWSFLHYLLRPYRLLRAGIKGSSGQL